MTCCGKNRMAASETTPHTDRSAATRVLLGPSAGAVSRPVTFECVGARGITVIGQGTGYRYRFVGYGARVSVDRRDRASLAAVPGLREVRG
jgi:hypothetical protein